MDEENQAIRGMSRAAQADALLRNELLTGAFDYIDNELIAQWRNCKTSEGRDRIWQATQIAARVKEILRLHIENGKVAKSVLNDLEGKRSRAAA